MAPPRTWSEGREVLERPHEGRFVAQLERFGSEHEQVLLRIGRARVLAYRVEVPRRRAEPGRGGAGWVARGQERGVHLLVHAFEQRRVRGFAWERGSRRRVGRQARGEPGRERGLGRGQVARRDRMRERRDGAFRRDLDERRVEHALHAVHGEHAGERMGRAEGRSVLRRQRRVRRRSEDEIAGVGCRLGHRDEEDRLQLERRVVGEAIDEASRDLPAPRPDPRIARPCAERHDRDRPRGHLSPR